MTYRKYGAKKTIVDGMTFDSKKEAKRYLQLKVREEKGEIKNLQTQVPFELIPAQKEPDTIGPKGGIKKGRTIERPCQYIADFVYEENGNKIVEDSKGVRTPDYVIKRKLMLYIHGIRIKET